MKIDDEAAKLITDLHAQLCRQACDQVIEKPHDAASYSLPAGGALALETVAGHCNVPLTADPILTQLSRAPGRLAADSLIAESPL